MVPRVRTRIQPQRADQVPGKAPAGRESRQRINVLRRMERSLSHAIIHVGTAVPAVRRSLAPQPCPRSFYVTSITATLAAFFLMWLAPTAAQVTPGQIDAIFAPLKS